MNEILWHDDYVELIARKEFSIKTILHFTDSVYGDARIEQVKAVLLDLSECTNLNVSETDVITAGALATASSDYAKIQRSACVSPKHDIAPMVELYGMRVACTGRSVQLFEEREPALKWLLGP